MAPSGRTTATSTETNTRRTRQQRRRTTTTNLKKKKHNTKNSNKKQQEVVVVVPTVLPSSCSSIISSQDSSKEVDMHGSSSEVIDVCNSHSNSPCSTPKGQRFRIPEISTCPPAPKKPRVLSNCSLRRSPLSFFAPPDLEHFFFVALRDVSV